jgi:hypothetical protein
MQLTLAELRNQVAQLSLISDAATRERLTRHLDALEGEAGRLNSAIRDELRSRGRRVGAAASVDGAAAAEIHALNDAAAAETGKGESYADDARLPPSVLSDLHIDVLTAAGLILQAATAETSTDREALRARFETAKARVERGVVRLTEQTGADSARAKNLRDATNALMILGSGTDGLFALRGRELDANNAARAQADAIRRIGEDLKGDVNDHVVTAESNALRAAAFAHDSVQTGRNWLLAIAGTSLVVSILIVWLFVARAGGGRIAHQVDLPRQHES